MLVWCLFVCRGIFAISTLPLWEGFDEFSHFAVIQHVALEAAFPRPDTGNSREVSQSLRLTPMPWQLRDSPEVRYTHDSYWKSPDRERLRRELQQIPPQRPGSDVWVPCERLYEAQQPPLYYVLAALPYRLMAFLDLDLRTRVFVLRLCNVLLASLAIPLAYFAAKEVLPPPFALTAALLVATMPGLSAAVFRVGNDALAVALGSAIVYLLVRRDEPSFRLAGWTLAAALLTKAYFLSLLPLAILSRKASWLPVALVAGPYYVWTFATTGSLTGEQHDVAAGIFKDTSVLSAIVQVNWRQAVDSTFWSYIWIGNWSFLPVRSWMYHGMAVLYALAAVRVPRSLALLAGLVLSFLAGIAYHVVVTFRVHGISSSTGWYLHALVAAQAILLAAGWGPRLAPIAAALFLALDAFGLWAYQLPYYAGRIAHTPDGRLAAYPVFERLETVPSILEQLSHPGFATPLLLLYATWTAGALTVAAYQWRRQ